MEKISKTNKFNQLRLEKAAGYMFFMFGAVGFIVTIIVIVLVG